MLNRELIKYIKNELDKKTVESEIQLKLLASGWKKKDIDQAFYSILHNQNLPDSDRPEDWKLFEQETYRSYRFKKRIVLFLIWLILIILLGGAFASNSSGRTAIVVYAITALSILFAYSFAHFATRTATPYNSIILEIIDICARILLPLLLILLILTGYCVVVMQNFI